MIEVTPLFARKLRSSWIWIAALYVYATYIGLTQGSVNVSSGGATALAV